MYRLHALITLAALLTLSACASTPSDVPVAVHSDPLGAFTIMQVQYRDGNNSDWIYIGVTPVDMNRNIGNFSSAKSVTMKVMKEGFFEQTKTWEINDFNNQVKSQGRVLWVPHLVKSGQ